MAAVSDPLGPSWKFRLSLIRVFWVIPVTLPAVLLLLVADSWLGRMAAVFTLCAAFLPLLAALAWSSRKRTWLVVTIASAAVMLGLAGVLLAKAPVGRSTPPSRVSHQYAAAGAHFPRYAPGNLLPEVDQLMAAFTLMTVADPLLTATQAAELKRLTKSLYRELEADPEFHALGSAMQLTYSDILHVPSASGHSYVYVPSHADRSKPRPVMVFFHGSGGNLKAYLWILSKLADELDWILVAPSNGTGNWQEAQSLACLDFALQAAQNVAAVDRRHVHLMGLSNGGLAVSQLAGWRGGEVESLVFLSPVFDDSALRSVSFTRQCTGRPVLVVTGENDDRVPLDYVEGRASAMTRQGARVRLQPVPGANHFLMFSHRQILIHTLAAWFSHPGAAESESPTPPDRASPSLEISH
ncbi:MAG: prolyl oligopeptidase family serine peptidase [Verrucomicrobia bacterium]|nr:prolyl oligopeptidase family serine peptidase [Verrucomicrobiota bacterium]